MHAVKTKTADCRCALFSNKVMLERQLANVALYDGTNRIVADWRNGVFDTHALNNFRGRFGQRRALAQQLAPSQQ